VLELNFWVLKVRCWVFEKATGCGLVHNAAANASVAITFTYDTCISQWAARWQWCYQQLSRQSHCGRSNTRLDHGASRYRTTTKGQNQYSPSSGTRFGQEGSLEEVLLSLHNYLPTFTCLVERTHLASATMVRNHASDNMQNRSNNRYSWPDVCGRFGP
jgi:hypothetical protein